MHNLRLEVERRAPVRVEPRNGATIGKILRSSRLGSRRLRFLVGRAFAHDRRAQPRA